jgi:1-deoxy-D-xylulose-5-phosphate synthase
MLYTGFQLNQPVAVRYPRGKGPGVPVQQAMTALPVGKAELRRRGKDKGIALLAFGSMVTVAEQLAAEFDATVVNMRFVKPLDEALLLQLATDHKRLVTLEENAIAGGAGSAVNECLAAHEVMIPVRNIGLPDCYIEQGSREELLSEAGLDVAGVRKILLKL